MSRSAEKIRAQIKARDKAQKLLREAIFENIMETASSSGITSMCFSRSDNYYYKGNLEVASKRLDALDDIYRDNLNGFGIQATWKEGEGWRQKQTK